MSGSIFMKEWFKKSHMVTKLKQAGKRLPTADKGRHAGGRLSNVFCTHTHHATHAHLTPFHRHTHCNYQA